MSRISLEQTRIRLLKQTLQESLPAYRTAAGLIRETRIPTAPPAGLVEATRLALPQLRRALQRGAASTAALRTALQRDRRNLENDVYEFGWLLFLSRPESWRQEFRTFFRLPDTQTATTESAPVSPAVDLRSMTRMVLSHAEGESSLAAVA